MNNYNYIPPQNSLFKINITSSELNNDDKLNEFLEKTYVQNVSTTNTQVKKANKSITTKKSTVKVTNWSIKLK